MAEARKLLQKDELEEFQWSVQEYIKHGQENGISADWEKQLVNASSRVHISHYEALKLQCYQRAWEASGRLTDGLHLLLQKIYTSMYYHTAYEVQKGVGHGLPFAKIDTAQVEKVLSKPWAADGSDFSERIWKNRAQLVQELDAGLTQGIIRGDPPDKLVKHLSDRFGVSVNRAQTLVQTESAHFANQAQSDNFSALGVAKYEVVAALDKNTCYTCGAMDGQQFPLSEEKSGVNAPLFHACCRCCKAPVVEDETPGGERAARGEDGNTYYVPEDMTYKEWAGQHGDSVPAASKPVTEPHDTYRGGVANTGKSAIITIQDTEIGRSVGAKALNYDIVDNESDSIFHFVEGSRIQNSQVFAGHKTKHPLHDGVAEGLTKQFGGDPKKWQHAKGHGVIDYNGEERSAEVHWFQEESVGKVKFKVKRWEDED